MRCEDARVRLDALRYGGEGRRELASEPGDGDPEAHAHVASCPACQAHRSRGAALDRILALDEATAPGPGFDTRFFARLDEARSARRRRSAWRWAWALLPVGVAAGVALMRAPAPGPAVDEALGADPMLAAAQVPEGDVALLMELDLVEELDVVERLDEVEAYELFEGVDDAALDAIMREVE